MADFWTGFAEYKRKKKEQEDEAKKGGEQSSSFWTDFAEWKRTGENKRFADALPKPEPEPERKKLSEIHEERLAGAGENASAWQPETKVEEPKTDARKYGQMADWRGTTDPTMPEIEATEPKTSVWDRLTPEGILQTVREAPKKRLDAQRAATEAARQGTSGIRNTMMEDWMAETEPERNERMLEEAYRRATIGNQAWLDSLRPVEEIEAELREAKSAYEAAHDADARTNISNAVLDYLDLPEKQKPANQSEAATERVKTLEDELATAMWAKYESQRYKDDFAEKSGYQTTANGKELEYNPATDTYNQLPFDDAEYEYVNGVLYGETAANVLANEKRHARDGNPFAPVPKEFEYTQLADMTADEKALYNYIYATQGRQAGHEYLEYLRSDLYARQAEREKAESAAYAKEHPVLSTLRTVATAPLKGWSYLGQGLDYLFEGTIDENAPYNRMVYLPQEERATVTKLIEDNWGGFGTFAYGVGTSMLEFLWTNAVAGGYEPLALALMGTGAAADATVDAKERGLSDGQAFALGTIAGFAEIITEKVSIENLFSGKWEKEPLRYLLKNTLAEGSEEGASDLINWVADILISGDKNEWQTAMNAYMKTHPKASDSEAFIAVLKEKGGELLLDVASGALSGFLMAAGPAAVGGAQKYQAKSADIEAAREAVKEQKAQNEMILLPTAGDLEAVQNGTLRTAEQTEKNAVQAEEQTEARSEAQTEAEAETEARTEAETEAQIEAETRAEETEAGTVLPTAEELETDNRMAENIGDDADIGNPQFGTRSANEGILTTAEESETDAAVRKALDEGNVTRATGIRHGANEKTIRLAERLSKVTGRTVEFYFQDAVNGTVTNGFTSGGKIYYNVNAKNPFLFTFAHEFTHNLEGTGAYDKLLDRAKTRMLEQGGDWLAKRAKTRRLYERAGAALPSNAEIDAEILADWMGDNLGDERTIREIMRDDPSLGKRVLDGLTKFISKAGDVMKIMTPYEEQRVQNIVDGFRRVMDYMARAEVGENASAEKTVSNEPTARESGVFEEKTAGEGEETGEETGEDEEAGEETGEREERSERKEEKPSARRTGAGAMASETQTAADQYRARIEERYDAGEITDEQYDEAMALADEMESTGRSFEEPAVKEEGGESKIGRAVKRMLGRQSSISEADYSDPAKLPVEVKDAVRNDEPVTVRDEVRASISYDEKYMDAAEKKNAQTGMVDEDVLEEARRAREEVKNKLISVRDIANLPEDKTGNTAFGNSAYGVSEESTSVCIRSLAIDALTDKVAEFVGRPLTVEESVYIAQEAFQFTDNPQCMYCYVAMDRMAKREYLGEYINKMNAVLDNLRSGMSEEEALDVYKASETSGGKAWSQTKEQRFREWARAYRNGGRTISAADLASEESVERALKDPQLREQVKDAVGYAQSASWAKKRVGYAAYNNHILKWKQSKIDALNDMFGLRFYSFSDFSPAFTLENMQMITDAAVRGLKGLGYTKDLDFVRIFAPTDMNIQVSVFGMDGTDGQVHQDGMQGADWKEAQALRDQYPNVGITFVATNDAQVEWALEQDWIDVVIPFHMVKTGDRVAKILGYNNYTPESRDRLIEGENTGKREIYPNEHQNDRDTYFRALAEAGLSPRFARWQDHPNYMKLVNETRRAAQDTPPMRPVFNAEAVKPGESLVPAAIAAIDKMVARGGYNVPIGGSLDVQADIAEEMADKIARGMAEGLKIRNGIISQNGSEVKRSVSEVSAEDEIARKEVQFQIIQNANPVGDDLHTWIRSADEIMNFREAVEEYGALEDGVTPDFTAKDVQRALRSGRVKVYSSYPIEEGIFVTPSRQIASDYAGGGDIYFKAVPVDDVAWIDASEGQYAPAGNLYGITQAEVKTMQTKGRKSINDFTSEEIRETEKWARKFYRELKELSPYFRAWFGDWRANEQTPVTVVGAGPSQYDNSFKVENDDTGKLISWGKVVRQETKTHAIGERISIDALGNIGEIVKNAIYLDTVVSDGSGKAKMPNSAFMHSFYTIYDDGAAQYLLKLYVEEALTNETGEIFSRAYQLKDIRKVADLPNRVHPVNGSLTDDRSATGYSIADLFDLVKTYDPEFHPKEASKIVNEDGKPKKVYHQTGADFWTFSNDKPVAGANDSETPNGYFFKENDHDIGLEGKKQMAVYLDMKRPLHFTNRTEANAWYCDNIPGYKELQDEMNGVIDPIDQQMDEIENRMFAAETREEEDTLEAEWNDLYEQMHEAEDRYRRQLRELLNDYFLGGNSEYDGIILDDDGHRYVNGQREDVHTYIVFDPTQVKSTTDNVGTFDRGDPDIRYSVSEVEPEADRNDTLSGLPQGTKSAVMKVERQLVSDILQALGRDLRPGTLEYRRFRSEVARPVTEAILRGETPDADELMIGMGLDIVQMTAERASVQDALRRAVGELGRITNNRRQIEARRQRTAERNAELDARIPADDEGLVKLGNDYKDVKNRWARIRGASQMDDEGRETAHKIATGQLSEEEAYAQNPFGMDEILTLAEAERAFLDAAGPWERHTKKLAQQRLDDADAALKDANADRAKDKASGFQYARETAERNFRDVFGRDAEGLIDKYIRPVHEMEAASTRFKKAYNERVKELGISRKTARGNTASEAYAVQFLGEAEDNVRVLTLMGDPSAVRDGMNLSEWQEAIENFKAANPRLDYDKIHNAINEFSVIYDELIRQMNAVLVRTGYLPVNTRRGYFPHFTQGNDGVLASFAKLIGIGLDQQALPTSINGLTARFKPGKTWFSHALERTGFRTDYDALYGFENYLKGVSDVIHQTSNIRNLRALSTMIRYNYSDEGIKKKIRDIEADENLDDAQKIAAIDELHENGRYKLSRFVPWLDEYTNQLANKKSKYDRAIEDLMGRKVYSWMKNMEGRVAANMIAGNLGSALTNFIPLNQAGAMLGRMSLLKGAFQTMTNRARDDDFVNRSDFLTNRRGVDPLFRGKADAISDFLSKPMNIIDDFTSEAIVRGAYNKYLAAGMDEQSAMQAADEFAAGVMADRSKGALPTIFGSHNPLTKLFTQFQVEVNNEWSTLFKDIPKGMHLPDREKKNLAALAAWTLLRYFLGAYLFNDLYEKIVGRRAALDPIDLLNDAVGDATGYKLNNVFDVISEGVIDKDKPANTSDMIGNLVKGAGEELPFVGGLLGGGRIPISSALPDMEKIVKGLANENWSGGKKVETIGRELGKSIGTYILPPFAGGLGKKLWQTGENAIRGGRYVKDSAGEEQLQYPYYMDNPLEAAGTIAKSASFGPTATEGGREWVENDFNTLSAKKTKVYEMLQDDFGEDRRTSYDLITTFYKILPTYDADGNGTIKQSEVTDALEGMTVPLTDGEGALQGLFGGSMEERPLTREEKAVLWQSYNKAWKPEKNPFDPKIGARVFRMLNGGDEDE